MKESIKNFIEYLFSLLVNIVLVTGLLVINDILNGNVLFTSENLDYFGISLLLNLMLTLFLLFVLKLNLTFQFEFFTYSLLIISAILIVVTFNEISEDIITGIIGIPILCVSLFSRIVLWKYDKSVIENKKQLQKQKEVNAFEFFRTEMPNGRKAEFYLGCYDGSVFIDFNKENNLIYLERISFDGYGCYNISTKEKTLSIEESRMFESEMIKEKMNQKIIKKMVLKLIEFNQNKINDDALKNYKLLT